MEFVRNNNFHRVSFLGKLISLDSINVFLSHGPESYNNKNILNVSLGRALMRQVSETEALVQSQFMQSHQGSAITITSSFKNDLLRTHVDKATRYIDMTHQCRVFSDLNKKDTYLMSLEYKGVWEYDNTFGHFWRVRSVEFIDIC